MENLEEAEKFINLGVVLNEKDEVLMIRRAKEEIGKDGSVLRWAFPGGKQRYAETREECVKREMLAETGYDVVSIRQIAMRMHPQISALIVYHLCRLNSPEPVQEPGEPHEVAEIKWVKREEIKSLVTTEINPKVMRELRI